MAAEQLVTQHLDLWTAAIKRRSSAGRGSSSKLELYGIKKLRELILELAVRGLLVPQDSKDEPASELLKRIEAEKAKLVKEGKIKKEKPQPPLSEDEKPFPARKNWQFVRLLSLSHEIGTGPFGSMIHQSDYVLGGIPLVNPSHMIGDQIAEDAAVAVDQEKANELSSYRLYAGDIVLARRGEVGRCAIVTERENGWLCGTGSFYLRLPLTISRRFMALVFRASTTRDYLAGKAVGTTMVNLNHGILNNLPIALPPLAEQHRIVAKVDELMALCDQLEQQTDTNLSAHQTLVETLLNALTSAADHAQFATSWQRIAEHFDTLFATEESIDQLKQTILQLAVMGKLVPQDPKDETASELLKRIAAEKAKLVKEGKIKKDKPLPAVSAQDVLFALPSGWSWARFGSVVSFESELVAPQDFPDFDQVAPDSIEKGTGKLLSRRTVAETGVTGPNNRFYTGQILYSKIRPSLSKAIIAEFDGLCSADMYPLGVFGLSKQFLLKVILSEPFLAQVRREENRIKMPKLNIPSLSNFAIAVPPFKEQLRIVAKVDELMVLCDQLKGRLSDAQATQLNLADALTEASLVGA